MKRPTPLVYIMSPYSDPSADVRQARFLSVKTFTGELLCRFPYVVFYSPIAYYHPFVVNHNLPTDFTYWREHNYCMLSKSDLGIVLLSPGWEKSKGVLRERTMCKELSISVIFATSSAGSQIGQALQKLA